MTRSSKSLIGVLLGFLCIFPLFLRREKKMPIGSADALLQKAQQEMRESQAKNRARAVAAITQKNNLQAMTDQIQKTVNRLTERIEALKYSEDMEVRQALLSERGKYEETLTQLQASLASANVTTEAVKTAMRREEERIRAMTAEALALKVQENQAQIEIRITKSKLAMTTTLATDLFGQAREKIKQTAAQRNLIVQIGRTVDALDEAADKAGSIGNKALCQKLTATREALKESALDAALWKC